MRNFITAMTLAIFLGSPVYAETSHDGITSIHWRDAHGGRQVEAPPWSFACMTDHGPSPCNEPMWVYH